MRQFSIYALSINQIVFTSSRRTSSQGEGAGTRVEGSTHTQFWRRVRTEFEFKVRLLDFPLRCFDEFIEKLRDIWEVFGLICRGYARSTRWPTDLGHVWQLWETETQFNQSCGKQQHRQKRQQIIALGRRSEGGRERREALDNLRICRMCQKFQERWQEAKKRTHVRVGVLTPVWLALAMGIQFLNWPVPFPSHLSPCAPSFLCLRPLVAL